MGGLQEQHQVAGADGASRLKAQLKAESEMAAVRDAAEAREAELRQEIERLRREKLELEARKGGQDLRQMEVRGPAGSGFGSRIVKLLCSCGSCQRWVSLVDVGLRGRGGGGAPTVGNHILLVSVSFLELLEREYRQPGPLGGLARGSLQGFTIVSTLGP